LCLSDKPGFVYYITFSLAWLQPLYKYFVHKIAICLEPIFRFFLLHQYEKYPQKGILE